MLTTEELLSVLLANTPVLVIGYIWWSLRETLGR